MLPTLARYLVDPYGVFGALARRYGDPFLLPVPGSRGTVVTGSPEGVKAILGAGRDQLLPWRTRALDGLVGPRSIFMRAGEQHRAHRRSIAPPFHAARLPGHDALMIAAARGRIEPLRPGPRLSVHELGQRFALDVVLAVLYGDLDPARSDRYHRHTRGMDEIGPSFLYLGVLRRRWGGHGPWARAQDMLSAVREMIQDELDARRAGRRAGGLLDHLMTLEEGGRRLDDAELVGRALDLVIAGHETTAVAIAWAVHELGRNPAALARAQAEAAGWDGVGLDDTALPYLTAVCAETLRVHPPLVFLSKIVARPLELCGHVVPEGVGVSLAVPVVHQREDVFPEPRRFRPERFLGRHYAAHQYLPFGGGGTRCVGAGFAVREVVAALVVLLRTWRFTPVSRRAVRASPRTITVAPVGGVPVVLSRP